MHKVLKDFEIQTDHPVQEGKSDLVLINRKKELVIKCIQPLDQRVKVKVDEILNSYLDLARELKKLFNMKVTVITLIIEALGTVPKNLRNSPDELEIKRRI